MKRVCMSWLMVFLVMVALPCPQPVKALSSSQEPQFIRLHVLANSDSLEDQRVKAMLRDELLAHLAPILQETVVLAEAEALIKANMARLTQVANAYLQQLQMPYSASIQYGSFNFPAKYYGTYSLPAGRYRALNVTLGAGDGRNWWCVLFPNMCFTAQVCQQTDAPSQTYLVRSKLLEWLQQFLSWCTGRGKSSGIEYDRR